MAVMAGAPLVGTEPIAACIALVLAAADAAPVAAVALNGDPFPGAAQKGLTTAFSPANMGPGNGGGSALSKAEKGSVAFAICSIADGAWG